MSCYDHPSEALLLLLLLLLQPQSDIQALALQPPVPVEALSVDSQFVTYTTSMAGHFHSCDSCQQNIEADDDEVKQLQQQSLLKQGVAAHHICL
jgi:hypothetical protein